MNLKQCYLTENECYIAGVRIKPMGVMVHSTGANNPNLRRYVQPDDGLLGVNAYNNDWNCRRPGGTQVCVHAFIGKLADGSVATYQTLPWDMRGWHSGYASKKSTTNANKMGYIGFEICEDALTDPAYFGKVYQEAVELTAYLCELYNLDPEKDGVVICHSEGFLRGIASNHADVMHWFPKHGKSMDTFRADVLAKMRAPVSAPEEPQPQANETVYKQLQDVPDSYRPSIRKLMEAGALCGVSDPDPNSLEDNILNLPETYCRVMTSLDRLGLLDK